MNSLAKQTPLWPYTKEEVDKLLEGNKWAEIDLSKTTKRLNKWWG